MGVGSGAVMRRAGLSRVGARLLPDAGGSLAEKGAGVVSLRWLRWLRWMGLMRWLGWLRLLRWEGGIDQRMDTNEHKSVQSQGAYLVLYSLEFCIDWQ